MRTQSLKCSYCHKTGHDSLHCYKKAWDYRLNRGKMRSKPLNSRSKAGVKPKVGKLSSSEQNERRKLIKELDRVTSLYVRLKDADQNGYAYCYTCGRKLFWRQLDCGHLFGRRHTQTRWDLDDLRNQCINCNRALNGNYGVYIPKMRAELGEERYWELSRKAHSTQKVTTLEMQELLKKRTEELKILVESRKKRGWKC